MSIVNFLLTGDDLKSIIPEISAKDREIRRIKKDAIVAYIYDKKENLRQQKEDLESTLNRESEKGLDDKIDATVLQIASIEKQNKGPNSAKLRTIIRDI